MVPIRERKTYSVLLADDLTLVREGLAALCAAHSQYHVVGQCSEGTSALRMIESQRPDLAVLDLNLPDLFTMEIVRRVREANLPRWRDLQMAFRRLEDRGEIRGGKFVDGFLGEQFGLPVAVESLRVTRKLPPTGETVTLSAADPLNLVGIVVPGERVPAISGRTVAFRDGVAVDPELTPLRFVNLAPSPSAYSAD